VANDTHSWWPIQAQKEHQPQKVPSNVTDWLHTLRRNTDSGEADDELRQKVESAAAASGITSSALGAAKNGATPKLKPEITAKKPVMKWVFFVWFVAGAFCGAQWNAGRSLLFLSSRDAYIYIFCQRSQLMKWLACLAVGLFFARVKWIELHSGGRKKINRHWK
jgi:hypothetical protein